MAARVADAAGGTPVVSTATDLAGIFAVDVWAAERSLHLGERALAKEVSAALLAGETVGFACDFPVAGALPAGLADGPAALGIASRSTRQRSPFRAPCTPFRAS
ncbi:MAG: cobalamin biosynthesis central domain-containing protein [Anaerotruncus massiliensis (ex Togo et al. 2019)]